MSKMLSESLVHTKDAISPKQMETTVPGRVHTSAASRGNKWNSAHFFGSSQSVWMRAIEESRSYRLEMLGDVFLLGFLLDDALRLGDVVSLQVHHVIVTNLQPRHKLRNEEFVFKLKPRRHGAS